MIRAVFFDIDGTIMSHRTRSVPESARQAIRQLKEKGIRCVVATGRQLPEIDKLPCRDIDFDGYITMNGQLIFDAQKQEIRGTPVEGAFLERSLAMFEAREYPVLLVEKDRMYLNFVNDHVVKAQEDISSAVPPIDTYSGAPLYQICVYLTEAQMDCVAAMEDCCSINRWHWGGADLVTKGMDKRTGIQEYLEANGIKPEEAMAFGDGDNDVEMLRYVGIGVAMGNGTDAAKAAADYITSDIDEAGIANGLRHFGIL